jgi:hypothetical protein
VAAIVTSGVGFVDAIQRGDKRALLSCSLTAGASALQLVGAISGHTSFCTVGMFLKWSKSGWTFFYPAPPSKTQSFVPTSPLTGSTPGLPGLSSWTYHPVSSSWSSAISPMKWQLT